MQNASKSSVLIARRRVDIFETFSFHHRSYFSFLNPTLIFLSFKPHNWLRHKSFKSRTFNACKWPRSAKIKNLHTKFFAKYKPVELTYHKAGLLMQYTRKYQAKKVMKFRILKVKSANSAMSGSQSFRGSFMIPVTT